MRNSSNNNDNGETKINDLPNNSGRKDKDISHLENRRDPSNNPSAPLSATQQQTQEQGQGPKK
jgi:hypothetical protein